MPLHLPIPALKHYDRRGLPADALAAVAVLFLAVPQGLAYATIAGLPPAVGLYAAAIPTVIGSLLRSSGHVISGPTNALSLLVGAAVAGAMGADPVEIALTLALMVGVIQALAGVLRLGAIVDFISSSVVLGYITGAGVLIGAGQLYGATGTVGPRGRLWETLSGWVQTLADTQPLPVAVALGTVAIVIAIRWLNRRTGRRLPSAIVAMVVSIAATIAFGLETRGLAVVSDLAAIPTGLPSMTMPDIGLVPGLIPVAVACAVLSLVESSAVARSIAARTGQRLEASTEFFGQGLSNLSAAFFGGYPVSGSLSRSVLNERAGARSRVAGILSGALMIAVLLAFGPILNHTPVASLAGLLFVVAYDLVDVPRIRTVLRTSRSDAAAFVATVVGTWTLSLDLAIYVGVGISVVLFLRRTRQLRVTELVTDADGRLQERPVSTECGDGSCPKVRLLQIEGALFFGAAGELQAALLDAVRSPAVEVLLVRIKRARGLDATTAEVFGATARLLRSQGRHLVLAGMSPETMEVLQRSGAADAVGRENLFPTEKRWFAAFERACQHAARSCRDTCDVCPLRELRPTRTARPRVSPR